MSEVNPAAAEPSSIAGEPAALPAWRRWLETRMPVLVLLTLVIVVVAMIGIVVGRGFLPIDDALRHAAKAISQKPWAEVLVLDEAYAKGMESHPGWHAFLTSMTWLVGPSIESLVVVSIVVLFSTMFLPGLSLARPEAWWLAAAVWLYVDPGTLGRWVLGRPLVLSLAMMSLVLILSPRLRDTNWRKPWLWCVIGAVALAVWCHSTIWYLWVLPVGSMLLAGFGWNLWRPALAIFGGVAIGLALSGDPFGQAWQQLQIVVTAQRNSLLTVSEFIPFRWTLEGNLLLVALLWRYLRGRGAAWNHPALIMAFGCAYAGQFNGRFGDFATIGILVWLASDWNEFLRERFAPAHWGRLVVAGAAGLLCIGHVLTPLANPLLNTETTLRLRELQVAADKWRNDTGVEGMALREGLPGPNGRIYNLDYQAFYLGYAAFYDATWRYTIGMEQALLPPDEMKQIALLRATGDEQRLLQWIEPMGAPDRIVWYNRAPPELPGIVWQKVGVLHFGRKVASQAIPAP